MDAGIDDQPHGAELFARELAELRRGIAVDAELRAQRLGVEPPALGERRGGEHLPELGQALQLARESDLQMMARARSRAGPAPRSGT